MKALHPCAGLKGRLELKLGESVLHFHSNLVSSFGYVVPELDLNMGSQAPGRWRDVAEPLMNPG